MFNLTAIREQFPALDRIWNGQAIAYFDGPAGSQVPQAVIDAIAHALTHTNANCGAAHVTSRETDALLLAARQACADLLNADSADSICFGANMTSLTFALARTLGATWNVGDEIIVSRLDHDANVTPWVLAAREAGVVVKHIDICLDDCTLDLDHYRSLLSNRTRFVAVGGASNATGTVNPIGEIVRLAKTVGAMTFIDAVHLAPHRLMDVQEVGCDFLACSAYKFFGPHVGILWGRPELLQDLSPAKLRAAPNSPPGKWMTGTQNHEGIAGVTAAIEYLASLAGEFESCLNRRERLKLAFAAIHEYEQGIGQQLLEGLQAIPSLKIWGITDDDDLAFRVPTVSVTHATLSPQTLAAALAERGLFVWAGNHYALPFTEAAGLEPQGTLRMGLLHYNTPEEVDWLLEQLKSLCSSNLLNP